MAARNNRAAEDIAEAQNREYHDRLASKSSYLKSIAFDIETEAKDHHKLLRGLDDDFDSASNFMSGTLGRIKHMMGSGRGNRQLLCYVSIGVVFTIFLLYHLLRRLTHNPAGVSGDPP